MPCIYGMNIAIMSPHCHGNGNTTVAALIASVLARQNKKVCLTHIKDKSDALYPYYNLQSGGAQSTDAVQLTKLIRTGGMQKGSFSNYCRSICDNYDLFSLDAETTVPEEDLAEVIKYIAENAPYDYVIYDVDENSLDKENVKAAIENADCAVLVLTQANTEISRFRAMKATFISRTRKIPVLVLVNKYRNVLGTVKELAKEFDIKNTDHWHVLHDNPYVMYCENKGQLQYLSEQIRKKDGEVLELDTDLQCIAKDIIATKRMIGKSRLRKQRREGDE